MREAERQLARIGMARADARAGRQPRARPAAADGDRARARAPTRRCCCSTSRPPACACKEKQALADVLRQLRGEGMTHPAGRARHGPRDGPGRPRRGDGVRHQADRGHAATRCRPARGARGLSRDGALSHGRDAACSKSTTCTPATAAPRCCTGLDLRAAPGQVVTVIGPNGAGKSTLLNALMGVLPCARPHRVRRPADRPAARSRSA